MCDAAVFLTASLYMSPRHWILSNVQAFIVSLVFLFHRSFIKVIFHQKLHAFSPVVSVFFWL